MRDSIRHGYNGFLVCTDPKALADALVEVLSNGRLREKLSRNAIEWAKQFSWDKSAEKFERIVRNL